MVYKKGEICQTWEWGNYSKYKKFNATALICTAFFYAYEQMYNVRCFKLTFCESRFSGGGFYSCIRIIILLSVQNFFGNICFSKFCKMRARCYSSGEGRKRTPGPPFFKEFKEHFQIF
uniref:Uncharacterized protein n=1 Tax=Cacopsylla melanoneura TaxID=428564 RepID=A0A8D8ZB61_9HEMI